MQQEKNLARQLYLKYDLDKSKKNYIQSAKGITMLREDNISIKK